MPIYSMYFLLFITMHAEKTSEKETNITYVHIHIKKHV